MYSTFVAQRAKLLSLKKDILQSILESKGCFLDLPQKVDSKKHKNPLNSLQKLAKNKATRVGKSPDQQQTERGKNLFVHQLNPKHPLYLLSRAITWEKLEEDMAPPVGRHGVNLMRLVGELAGRLFATLCRTLWRRDFLSKVRLVTKLV